MEFARSQGYLRHYRWQLYTHFITPSEHSEPTDLEHGYAGRTASPALPRSLASCGRFGMTMKRKGHHLARLPCKLNSVGLQSVPI